MVTLVRSRSPATRAVWLLVLLAGALLAACTQDFGRYRFLPDDAGASGGTPGSGGAGLGGTSAGGTLAGGAFSSGTAGVAGF